jgi:hypothetical protein
MRTTLISRLQVTGIDELKIEGDAVIFEDFYSRPYAESGLPLIGCS